MDAFIANENTHGFMHELLQYAFVRITLKSFSTPQITILANTIFHLHFKKQFPGAWDAS